MRCAARSLSRDKRSGWIDFMSANESNESNESNELVSYDPIYDKEALDRFAETGAEAWADVPDATAWVREERGGSIQVNTHARKIMTSSVDMTWATPKEWFNYLNLEFDFTLDPCCAPETAKCKRFFTPKEDGLAQSWAEERVFMNPPYGRELGKWMDKAYREARDNGALVVCFVPARVDTNWWHRFASKGEIRFPKGRVKFEGASASAPFPVAIVIFRPKL